jgi:hypothetical protein
MDTFDEGIKLIKYIIEEVDDFKIYIYYADYDEKKLREEIINENKFPEQTYYLSDSPPIYSGSKKTLHLFYERKRFYGINADGSAHHFRLGVALTDNVINLFKNKYANFKLMENNKLESGLQNKVFYIELLIKETAKKNQES